MKKQKFKIKSHISLIIIFALIFNLFMFNLAVSALSPLPVYLSLGDSIAAGYGLKNPKTEGYAYLMESNINQRYTLVDSAVPGYDTADLLKQLSDTSDATKNLQSALTNASVITVSIGGNNILKPLMEVFGNMNPDSFNGLPESMTNIDRDNFDPGSINQSDILTVMNMISKYFTPGTSEYASLAKALDKGIEQFKTDIDKIYNIISKNKNAKIIFLTVYNPFKSFGNYIKGLNDTAEKYIGEINKIINEKSSGKYIVADVYTKFNKTTQSVVNADLVSMNIDVHPNAAGHKIIYKTIANSLGLSAHYSDMSGDAWATEYVDELFDLGIMFGTNTQRKEFSPKAELKNMDLAVLLARTLKLKISDADVAAVNLPFLDADKIEIYALNCVKACYKAGLYNDLYPDVSGKTYEFAPQNPARRIDVAVMVAQIIDKTKWTNNKLVYTDISSISESYYPALSTLYDYGIITGNPDKTLNPFSSITRAQAAKILFTILQM